MIWSSYKNSPDSPFGDVCRAVIQGSVGRLAKLSNVRFKSHFVDIWLGGKSRDSLGKFQIFWLHLGKLHLEKCFCAQAMPGIYTSIGKKRCQLILILFKLKKPLIKMLQIQKLARLFGEF